MSPEMASDLLDRLRKYVKWCEDDRLRQKYANPGEVRDFILDDARAAIAAAAGVTP